MKQRAKTFYRPKHEIDWQLRAIKAESLNAELLAALKDLMWRFDEESSCNEFDVVQARAVIARAEGK